MRETIVSLLTNNMNVVLVFIVIFLLTVWFIQTPKNLPPGPMPLPFVGNSWLIAISRKQQYEIYHDLQQQYGDIVTFYLGRVRGVILNSYELFREANTVKAEIFSHRFVIPALNWTIGREGSVAFGTGKEWKERRRFLIVALKNFGVGKKSLEYKINEEARYVMEKFDELKGEPINPRKILANIIANVVCSINFGRRYDYDDKAFHHVVGLVGQVASGLTVSGIIQALPFLVYTPLYSFVRNNVFALKNFVKEVMKEHEETLNEDNVRDIIDMYLLEIRRQQKEEDEVVFKPEDAWRLIMEIFLGGTETTSQTLLFLILLMTQYPDVCKKVQAEIDRTVGMDRQPSINDRPNLPYTEATIFEMQRFKPIAAQIPPRQVSEDVELGGYTIPKGTAIFVNIYGILHDPELWDKPEEFNPSRFLSEDGSTTVRPEYFIPFGMGRRICAGEHLARMEIFLFFVNFMQRFDFKIPEGDPKPSLDIKQGITSRPVEFRVCITPRN